MCQASLQKKFNPEYNLILIYTFHPFFFIFILPNQFEQTKHLEVNCADYICNYILQFGCMLQLKCYRQPC